MIDHLSKLPTLERAELEQVADIRYTPYLYFVHLELAGRVLPTCAPASERRPGAARRAGAPPARYVLIAMHAPPPTHARN